MGGSVTIKAAGSQPEREEEGGRDGDEEIQRCSISVGGLGLGVEERISNKAPLTVSQKRKSFVPLIQTRHPPLPQPLSPSLPARVFKSPCGMDRECVLEKFVSGKGRVAV